jgi:hypothetical protein
VVIAPADQEHSIAQRELRIRGERQFLSEVPRDDPSPTSPGPRSTCSASTTSSDLRRASLADPCRRVGSGPVLVRSSPRCASARHTASRCFCGWHALVSRVLPPEPGTRFAMARFSGVAVVTPTDTARSRLGMIVPSLFMCTGFRAMP